MAVHTWRTRAAARIIRRPTKYGFGFNAWFASASVGLTLVIVGVGDRHFAWWGSVLMIIAGLGFLVEAWLVVTDSPPSRSR